MNVRLQTRSQLLNSSCPPKKAIAFVLAILLAGSALGWGAASEPSRLLNISARGRVGTGNDVLIGGFIVSGSGFKTVVVRVLGPSLQANGTPIAGRLADPTLELYAEGSNVPLATNDDWKDTQRTQLIATGLQPTSDFEAAIVRTLAPGNYTTVVRGKNSGVGIGLVETYEISTSAPPKLANVSTRALVQSGDNVLIGGFIVGGGTSASSTISVVIRAIGPSLANSGISNPLRDTTLELVDANGFSRFNDDWRDGTSLDFQRTGLAPTDERESVIATTLPAGAYTAIVRGKDQAAGTGLIEVYDAPIPTF